MVYKYDMFISYRRDDETRRWLNTHLIPLLGLHVGQSLGRKVRIFVDDQLETGILWPAALGKTLGQSRVLVPLWAKDYLASKWCHAELNAMWARQKAMLAAAAAPPKLRSLILPFVIHDGESMPKDIAMVQLLKIQDCFNVRMAIDSPRAEALASLVQDHADDVARAINAAPSWQSSWVAAAAADFDITFRQGRQGQRKPPRFGD